MEGRSGRWKTEAGEEEVGVEEEGEGSGGREVYIGGRRRKE